MPKVTQKVARKDYPDHGIKRGDTYYTWKFYRGAKRMSKVRPRGSQLTQREDYGALREAQEALGAWESDRRTELVDEVAQAIGSLETARDAAQGKYDNLPEVWQSGQKGDDLSNFVQECEDAISELEGIKDDLEDTEGVEFDEIDEAGSINWPQEWE